MFSEQTEQILVIFNVGGLGCPPFTNVRTVSGGE